MAGTLTATVAIGQTAAAPLTGSGSLSAQANAQYSANPATTGSGNLDASAIPRLASSASLAATGVLTMPLQQKYTPAPALSSSGSLSATATKAITLLDFTDTFNRANNDSPGDPWISYGGVYGDWAINGNMLVNSDPTNGDYIYYGPLAKSGQKVTVKVGHSSNVFGFFQLWLRSNNDLSITTGVVFVLGNYGSGPVVALGFLVNGEEVVTDYPDITWSAGDEFTVMSVGNETVLLKNNNAVATIVDNTNAMSAWDATCKTVALGASAGASPGVIKIDQIRIQEINSIEWA